MALLEAPTVLRARLQKLSDAGALARLLWRAGRWRSLVQLLGQILRGIMPNVLIVAIGALVGAVPAAVAHGVESPAGYRALRDLGLAALTFGVAGNLESWTSLGSWLLGARYILTVREAYATAVLRPGGAGDLETPEIAATVAGVEALDRTGLHDYVVQAAGALVFFVASGVGAAVLLLGLAWWAPLLLATAWLIVSQAVQAWTNRLQVAFFESARGPARRAGYLRSVALEPLYAKEVRSFGLAAWLVEGFERTWSSTMRTIWAGRRLGNRNLLLSIAALVTAYGVVLAALGLRASLGELSADRIAIYGQALLGIGVLGITGEVQTDLGRAAVNARQILQLEERLAPSPGRLQVTSTTLAPSPGRLATGEIRFEAVSFAYPGGSRPVLDDLDLVIEPEQSLAIVGENGAGKSTIIRLLCQLSEPQSGHIYASRVDIASLNPPVWREQLAVIFQDFVRYPLSLAENVGLGCPRLRGEKPALERALVRAGGGDLLEQLPKDWDTVLAAGYRDGVELSGGQWQKVALARALLAVEGGARLLVLDEPTASLDVRAEIELFQRLAELTAGLTTVLVTHRLSSVRRADRIVVLDGGRITEDGTHEQLMASGGRYATMFALQAQRFRAESTDA